MSNLLHVDVMLGEYSWTALWREVEEPECPAISPFQDSILTTDDQSVLQSAKKFTLALDSLKQVTQKDFHKLQRKIIAIFCWTVFSFGLFSLLIFYSNNIDKELYITISVFIVMGKLFTVRHSQKAIKICKTLVICQDFLNV